MLAIFAPFKPRRSKPFFGAMLGKAASAGAATLRLLRQLLRFVTVIAWIVSGFVCWCVLRILLPWRPAEHCLRGFMPFWMRVACFLLGVRVSRAGHAPLRGSLLLCNHISWLDIVVIGSSMPVRFVAKREVRAWPIIGLLAQSAGTLFLARGKRDGDGCSEQVRADIVAALGIGDSVLVFPEGTTSDGRAVRRFHARLIPQDTVAVPLALSYRGRGAATVPFLGTDDFFSSLWRIVGENDIQGHLQILTPLSMPSPALLTRLSQQSIAMVVQGNARQEECLASSLPPRSSAQRDGAQLGQAGTDRMPVPLLQE